LLPEPSGRFPDLPAAAVAGFLVMCVPLHVSEDSVAEDQSLEEPKRSLHPALPHGHFQRTMANDRSSVETPGVPMLSVVKAHAPPLITLIAIEKINAARLVPLGVVAGQTA
jgi:hypothetical protein